MNQLGTVTHRSVTTIDLIIIGLYFLIIFAIGFYFARRELTSTDYPLASRNIGWFAIGASLLLSNISTEHVIGLSGPNQEPVRSRTHLESHRSQSGKFRERYAF